jgi:predicted DNA-binding transcriptional regulator AlpA
MQNQITDSNQGRQPLPRLLVSPDEAAEMLCMSVSKLFAILKGENPPPSFKLGGSRRFDVEELKAWIKDQPPETPQKKTKLN